MWSSGHLKISVVLASSLLAGGGPVSSRSLQSDPYHVESRLLPSSVLVALPGSDLETSGCRTSSLERFRTLELNHSDNLSQLGSGFGSEDRRALISVSGKT